MKRTKNPGKVKKFKSFMRTKLLIVFCIVLLLMCGLIGRLVYLNNTDGNRYEKRVLSQQSYVSSTIPYQRGSILDRNGTTLAVSKKVYNVILDPKVLLTDEDNVNPTIQALCDVFGTSPIELNKTLTEKADSSYIILLKKQAYEAVDTFKKLQKENRYIKGVWFEEDFERTYPYGSLASHVIGYTSAGNVGTWGIEQYYSSTLNGTNGRTYGYFDSELNLQRTTKPAVNGNTIVSTIDANVQKLVEQHIAEFMDEMGANNIGVIVSNPNNGQIYAMASNKGFDLNDPYNLDAYYTDVEQASMTEDDKTNALFRLWRNFCISDTYEPGSTWKPFTVAAALEEDLVTPETTHYCNGYEQVDKYKIKCNAAHGNVTLAESLMRSCNPYMIMLGEKLGAQEFIIYQDRFNIGKKTGIDLPGESVGILTKPENMHITELATSSFGQTFNVTMVQMLAGFSSLINGGYYYQPTLVKEIRNDAGIVVDSKEPVVLNETVSMKTSEFLRNALYLTVDQGTAKPAKVEGYLVGGKTGTAQKGIRTDKANQKYVVSFIGCVPADDPQVVIYVVIDEIHDQEKKGSSSVATALTSKILKDILPFLEVYPEGEIEYKVELPVKNEEPLKDENGNIINENGEIIEPFTDNDAAAIPEDYPGYNPNVQEGDTTIDNGN